jgi:hypothetical protein
MSTSRKFLITGYLASAAILGTFVAFNAWFDIYGIFRPAQGREIHVISDERTAKYLLALNYVPANFDAVLIGTSISGNWDPRDITSYRMYNASYNGGNIIEAMPMLENLLQHDSLKMIMFCLYPRMTYSLAGRRAIPGPDAIHAALGSFNLLGMYAAAGLAYGGWLTPHNDPRGRLLHLSGNPPGKPWSGNRTTAWNSFDVDAEAFSTLRAAVAMVKKKNIRIARVYPPLFHTRLEPDNSAYLAYQAKMESLFTPEDTLIDFNLPAHRPFRASLDNFTDGTHFTDQGAHYVSQHIDAVLRTSTQPAMRGE